MSAVDLPWLAQGPAPDIAFWTNRASDVSNWDACVAVARSRGDFVAINKLDRKLQAAFAGGPPEGCDGQTARLAMLSSSTSDHLIPSLRVAALRRNIWLSVWTPPYGQFRQSLLQGDANLDFFQPDTVLLAIDAVTLLGRGLPTADRATANSEVERSVAELVELWRAAKSRYGAQVIQQTIAPTAPLLFGSNEHLLPGSPAHLAMQVNHRLRAAAAEEGVALLAIDDRIARDGLQAWHDPGLWHRAKQEFSPAAAPLYGDLTARLIAAQRGKVAKCLVLDLDNTLWGGVIGDDGLEGIILGQGSGVGESFLALQAYARSLSQRGVLLAVCSKNDEANAREPFLKHPEMLLRFDDIACFVANWEDKPSNLRTIAKTLNIGLDALVFVDDNPFERNIVRTELPMVAVPELPEDPADYVNCIADAGYFEALSLTAEDIERTRTYRENTAREAELASSTDVGGYLRSLNMRLIWSRWDRIGLARSIQLLNKTNQFNLMTRRYTDAEGEAILADQAALGLQLRLTDRFGDNGIIAVLVARRVAADTLDIESWVMSCRVLGRGVEQATLNVLVQQARQLGVRYLTGSFRPTAKNAMVKQHYPSLGFSTIEQTADGFAKSRLDIREFLAFETHCTVEEAQ